jgi:formylglycine-generating enzyme required for sulfatase activity
MEADGSNIRQLCFDQDHDYHPSVLANGQILYTRWDYTGINHIFLRQLMVMNPDGTGQRAVYGSNSWFPNSLFHVRQIPGKPGMLVAILSGYHGVHKMGWLVVLDASKGSHGKNGIICRISGRGDPVREEIKDALVDDDWPKFMHPYPLDDKYFLVSCLKNQNADWAVYLADIYDNLTLLHDDPEYALIEPIPLKARDNEPVIPSKVNLSTDKSVVYLQNVYSGPGLKGVPAGLVKSLRVIAYHFGYRHMAGPHKIGFGGPWEVMRIIGTVPVEEDGSAMFNVPANTPIALQALDDKGQAVQLMRSWMTVMPGEFSSCIGCHEDPRDTPVTTATIASRQPPREIEQWYGPIRGFDFEREVQPVLDTSCVECHDGQKSTMPDLRSESHFPDYKGLPMSMLGRQRQHPDMKKVSGDKMKYTPAYDALLPYVRRVGIEDDVSLLVPGTYRADTSELIQMLRNGHKGVQLDPESWQRLITWIDLNAPCHGSWNDAFPVPENSDARRREMAELYAGLTHDPEKSIVGPRPVLRRKPRRDVAATVPPDAPGSVIFAEPDWKPEYTRIQIEEGVAVELARIPAGDFLMGDPNGRFNERPAHRVRIENSFWMARFEISNEQYALFDTGHDSGGYYAKRHARSDDRGLPLDAPLQPAVGLCWNDAVQYCEWLSRRTGIRFRLPTEEEWEFACRAGSSSEFSFGGASADFSQFANMADQAFRTPYHVSGVQITGGVAHLALCGAHLADARFNDGYSVTAPIGSFKPNRFGLFDMHGNVAEWTASRYRDYASAAAPFEERYVLRGGSFCDRPTGCRSAARIGYEPWHRIFNAGFRVVSDQIMIDPGNKQGSN